MGRAAVRARMKRRACQGLGRRGSCSPLVERSVKRESRSAFLPKENCNRQQTTTRTPAPPLIRNASAKRSRPGRGRPGVAPAGSVYGAVISGRFCVDQDLNIDLGPKSSSGPGFDTDHTGSASASTSAKPPEVLPAEQLGGARVLRTQLQRVPRRGDDADAHADAQVQSGRSYMVII